MRRRRKDFQERAPMPFTAPLCRAEWQRFPRSAPQALAALLMVGIAAPQVRAADHHESLDAELSQILQRLPGRYQGEMPVMSDPSGKTVEPVFHKIVRIAAPRLGHTVFYHQIGREGPDGQPAQQKIYVFDESPSRTVNSMRSFVIPRGRGLQNLETLAPELAALAPETLMRFPPECAIRWRRAGSNFEAHVSSKDCQYASMTWKTDVRPDMTYVLTRRSFSLQESMYYADGKPMFEMAHPSVAQRMK
jgi:hypothetical protein